MKVCGIIAEYNPFHNGHKHQVEAVRKMGFDYIIAIMSGDFTQRGEPAIIDKYSRTRMALKEGIDLCIELPAAYATADAGRFASGGISILNSLGVVDNVAFGVEAGCEDFCIRVADFLSTPPEDYQKALEAGLKAGLSYPVARNNAMSEFLTELDLSKLSGSNTILAIEYCKALKELDSNIIPLPVTRLGSDYNDTTIDEAGFSSASSIRNLISLGDMDYELLNSHMPEECVDILKTSYAILPEDISAILHYKLLTSDDLSNYLDVTESFADRIVSHLKNYSDYESFCDLLKSKNITHSSVRRLLSHILLDLKCVALPTVPYARVLGFRKSSTPLLNAIKAKSSIPMITKMADYSKIISGPAIDMLNADIKAANIYESIITGKYSVMQPNEFTREIIILD